MSDHTRFVPTIQPLRMVRAQSHDFGYEHEVLISLPASYGSSDKSYPVLWVMDGSLFFHTASAVASLLSFSGRAPEFIVVGVGHAEAGFELFGPRRLLDYFPMKSLSLESIGDVSMWDVSDGGYAPEFLSFLVDELRPALESEFRMRPDGHTLSGSSGGGYFTTYTLLTRPDAFSCYLAAAPPFNLGAGSIFDLEAAYARDHADLAAKVYFCAGAMEIFEKPVINQLDIVSSTVRMASSLSLREYPSLELHCEIIPGSSHATVPIELFQRGIELLWGSETSMDEAQARAAEMAVAASLAFAEGN